MVLRGPGRARHAQQGALGGEAPPRWACSFSLGLRIMADVGQAQAHSAAHTQAA